jgi:hypothetical protein
MACIKPIRGNTAKLVDARKFIDQFHAMIRKRTASDLDPSLIATNESLIAPFASGVER